MSLGLGLNVSHETRKGTMRGEDENLSEGVCIMNTCDMKAEEEGYRKRGREP